MSPKRPLRPCSYPGCPNLVEGGGSCPEHAKQEQRQQDKQRGTAAQRGYGYRWQKARESYLKRHPLCVECVKQGRIVPATAVDHVIPHKGNQALFWDVNNWQSLCKRCHDAKTAKEVGWFGKR